MREEEIEKIKCDDEMDESEKNKNVLSKRAESIGDVLEEVDVLIDTYFFNQFAETKTSAFLKKVIAHQNSIDTRLLKKTWRSLNCTPKTLKVIREIQENLLCVGKRMEMITRQNTDSKCWCSKVGVPLNAKHIISCCKKLASEISARHDIVVNILLNNILKQRGLIAREQMWEGRKTVRTAHDEITVGTEHPRSEEWKAKGRVTGSKQKPGLVWLRRDS